jgi:hypothetical protein
MAFGSKVEGDDNIKLDANLHAVMELMRTDHEFLLYGLWVAAITCLGGALLFAGLSALFAVVNTATTPIGMATGVPGLYLWNSLASECVHCLWQEAMGHFYATIHVTSSCQTQDSW